MATDGLIRLHRPMQTKSSGKKSPLNSEEKRDWDNAVKEYVREKYDKNILHEKRHDELWFKSQSIMYGKPRDYFDRQDKRAMLIEPGESKRKSYFPKKKSSDFVIKLGKNCYLGFKDKDKMKQGDPRLTGAPLSCGF